MEDLTEPRFGQRPEERTIPQLLTAGVVVVDKPQGPTSHQVSAWIRDLLDVPKAAHGGTLDPRVTGVLPVALGAAVRAVDALHLGPKEYVGVLRLHQDVSKAQVQEMMAEFVGGIYQMPPVRAAVKRTLRVRRIHRLDLLDHVGRDFLFRVRCESGTYIRTLCVDLGEALGVGGHLQDLRRTRTAAFTEEDARPLNDLRDAWVLWKEQRSEEELRGLLRPVEAMLGHLRRVIVKDTSVDALCHGASLAAPGLVEIDEGIARGDLVAVMTRKGESVGVGRAEMTADQMLSAGRGVAVTPDRVLMAPGTYPKLWK